MTTPPLLSLLLPVRLGRHHWRCPWRLCGDEDRWTGPMQQPERRSETQVDGEVRLRDSTTSYRKALDVDDVVGGVCCVRFVAPSLPSSN